MREMKNAHKCLFEYPVEELRWEDSIKIKLKEEGF
jgi:hypothetical protein